MTEYKFKWKLLRHWILERQCIYVRKLMEEPRPWTDDEILNTYRFCNVYREQDKVTIWIAKNLRDNKDKLPWFTMTLARLLNLPESLEVIRHHMQDCHDGTIEWDRDYFVSLMQSRQRRGLKVFNAAYIVSTNGHAMNKIEYVADMILQPMWDSRTVLNSAINTAKSLEYIHKLLMGNNGLASFMAAQVVADLKHYRRFKDLPDVKTFAAPGPGSKRGMNRVLGREAKAPISEKEWRAAFAQLHAKIIPWAEAHDLPFIDGQDLQNCLCEFDKYMRALNGEGTPKQRY